MSVLLAVGACWLGTIAIVLYLGRRHTPLVTPVLVPDYFPAAWEKKESS